jgi:hypothetical protein
MRTKLYLKEIPTTRSIWQGGYEKPWSGILSRKISSADSAILKEFCRTTLYGFARFSDVELESKLAKGHVSKETLRQLLGAFVLWLQELERGADYLFMQTSTEPAMEVYRGPLQMLRELLLDIEDGSNENAWSILADRPRGPPIYDHRVAEFLDQAARTYTFLLSIAVRSEEAIEAINLEIRRWRERVHLSASLPTLTAKKLNDRNVEPIADHMASEALEAAQRNIGQTVPTRLDALAPNQKQACMSSIILHLISGHFTSLTFSNLSLLLGRQVRAYCWCCAPD